jgi:2,4-dienoyl-CoA reductase-like NADH-dependent reductase (Old Yellow Enzyme family)/thioredoxin reductase
MRLQKLFEPTAIGGMTVKNRLVMAPMETNFGADDGSVTPQLIDYYEERARGGVGMIIVQGSAVAHPEGKATVRKLGIDDDRFLDGLSELAQAIKRHGARAAIQLEHGGGVTHSAITGRQPAGPSPTVSPLGEPVRQLSVSEIAELAERWARAARLAQKAGFEGVEIHAAHEQLLAQFLSPNSNQRGDQYGGSLENRARFLLEVVRACRESVGHGYPVWCRINAAEYGEGPADCAEAVQVAGWAEEVGADAVHVSATGSGARRFVTLCPGVPGFHLPAAAEVKRTVRVPVIAVGHIYPELGEWALREGIVDLIAIGRALIADPYLPAKAGQGRLEDIVPCIGCLECVESNIRAVVGVLMDPSNSGGVRFQCSVNPSVGGERDCSIRPTESPKRVVVVGGGPAGMEAARVARLRGHDVTLMEKDVQLGGQLIPAAMPPHKEGISLLTDYLSAQMAKLNVRVESGREATVDTIGNAGPGAVIWAAGVIPVEPEIEGMGGENVVAASEVLTGVASVGDTVVVIGAELIGCETASFLAQKGKQVTVVRRGPQVMAKVSFITQTQVLDDLARHGVELLAGVEYVGFSPEGLTIRTAAGETRTLAADTFVLATGARPNSDALPFVRERYGDVQAIGDALEPRRIIDAMREGFEAGLGV